MSEYLSEKVIKIRNLGYTKLTVLEISKIPVGNLAMAYSREFPVALNK